jgi:hypothetical protein
MESGGITPPFLTWALCGGEWSASRPCCCIPGETTPPRTQCIGGSSGPKSRPGRYGEYKNILPLPGIEP